MLEKIINEYLTKILIFGCNIKPNDSLIVRIFDNNYLVEKVFLDLKQQLNIKEIVFERIDYKKVIDFLNTNPNDYEIKIFVNKISFKNYPLRIKLLNFITYTYNNYLEKFYEHDNFKKFFLLYNQVNYDIKSKCGKNNTISFLPTKDLANKICNGDLLTLFTMLNNAIGSNSDIENDIYKLNCIKKELNNININELFFYNKLGTELSIKLNPESIWQTININDLNNNFPSYEVFTSPNSHSANGKIVISKPTFLYNGIRINTGYLVFKQGKVVSCNSDNDLWNKIVYYEKNNLNYVGEIALVSSDNNISKLNKIFNSVILEENSHCHLALGDSLNECINLDKSNIINKTKYNFTNSLYHHDIVFGTSDMTVEAKCNGKIKTLLLDGKWNI